MLFLSIFNLFHSVLETIDECEMVSNTTANATETSFSSTTQSSAAYENGNNDTKKNEEQRFVSRQLLVERPRLPDRFHQCQLTITT
jgi:hypothetical protein